MESGTRPPAVSGAFYPAEKKELVNLLSSFFAGTRVKLRGKQIKALILPHAGFIYSGQTAAWGYHLLPENLKHQHFVLLGPSHHDYFFGLAGDSTKFWETPLGKIKQLSISERYGDGIVLNPVAHLPEHCLEVQLLFLQYLYQDNFSFTALLTGSEVKTHEVANYLITNFKSSILIISSDLSHYLSEKVAQNKDKKTIKAILNLDTEYFDIEENAACGREGIKIILKIAKLQDWQRQLIFYDTSATASGDKNRVVGYGAIAFYV